MHICEYKCVRHGSHPRSIVTFPLPDRPAELVAVHVYTPNPSSAISESTRVSPVSSSVVVAPSPSVNVHSMVKSAGTLLEIERVRLVDCPRAILVLVADTVSSGGTVIGDIVACDNMNKKG